MIIVLPNIIKDRYNLFDYNRSDNDDDYNNNTMCCIINI